MPSALEAHALNKTYGSRRVLHDISLRVHDAEHFVILGPSAAGKTTLLRLFAGLERADSGSISLAGKNVSDVPPERRKAGLVFQNGALFGHLNVFDNLAFPLRIARHTVTSLRERVSEMSARFEIEPLLKRPVRALSGGERQRVAIARALLGNPHALLLDEPLAHLDPSAKAPVRESLLDVTRGAGLAVVLVTHDHEEALAIADRLAILIDGRIAQCDAPARMYDNPASTAVARFLGPLPMNLFTDINQQFGEGNATLGIRPQHICLGGASSDLEGVIRACEFGGPTWLAQVETPLGIFAVADPSAKPTPGDRVRLNFMREKIRRFDPATGAAIV